MKWLSRYLQQVFCKHTFIVKEQYVEKLNSGIRQNFTCKKCGYSYSKWKFL